MTEDFLEEGRDPEENAAASIETDHEGSSTGDAKVHGKHAAAQSKSKVGKRVLIVIGVIVAILLCVAAAFAIAANTLIDQGSRQFAKVEWPEDIKTIEYEGKTYHYNPNVISVCVIGNDKVRHDPGLLFNGQADSINVVAIDTETGKTTVITVPRDTMVEQRVTNYGTEEVVDTEVAQICLSYAYGKSDAFSSESVCLCVSEILNGVPMDYYFTIDELAIPKIADAIGGVTLTPLMDIPEAHAVEGVEMTLKGDDALYYVLMRDTEQDESAELRHRRHQQFIRELASQTIKAVKANPALLTELYDVAAENATTNLDLSQFSYLASIIMDHGISSFESIELVGEVVSNPRTEWEELYLDEDDALRKVLEVYYTES